MSKNTTDELREQLEEFALHIKPGTTKGKHRTAIFDTLELAKLVEQLISNREKLLLDRVEKEVLSDVEVRADQTDVIDDIEDWLQGGGIPPSYDYGRIHVLANERHKVLRRKLATLRKELDGGQE